MRNSRRSWLKANLALFGVASLPLPASADTAHVVIVGGGFAGASCALTLRQLAPNIRITLIEPKRTYTACPFSNLVIADERAISEQQFDYAHIAAQGINIVHQRAIDVDPRKRQVKLDCNESLKYDRLVMSPGIQIQWQALPGYDRQAADILPHAWQAGQQTLLLRDQLKAMRDGGVVAMSVPEAPYRCPPGPYERASLIAYYLKRHKPKSKLLILDSKDNFSKQPLFEAAWQAHYPGLLEWQGASDGARVVAVEAKQKVLQTDFDTIEADVANVIPPQQAGEIASRAELVDASGWCPIDALTFASTRQQNIYVIGDAAIANAMPKSAFAANAQAKLCAVQVFRDLTDQEPITTKLANTCYSLVSPTYGISVAGVYEADHQAWRPISGAGGISAVQANPAHRALEAQHAHAWFEQITEQTFGIG